MESFEKHLDIVEADQTAISFLSNHCPNISKQKLKQAMQYGAVWLTQNNKTSRCRRAKKQLNTGDTLHIYYDEKILFSDITPAQLIADEGEYSLWNKPCGMFSQGSKWGDHTSITRWVELFGLSQNGLLQRPTFLVHRLDRATNGLMIVAHSKKATTLLTQLFEQRKIQKHYQAVVEGDYPYQKFQKLDAAIDDKEASSIVLSADFDKKTNQSILLIKIETGRKHQIRKHLSGVGFPIIGDRLYTSSSKVVNKVEIDLQLKSCYLAFESPFEQQSKVYSI